MKNYVSKMLGLAAVAGLVTMTGCAEKSETNQLPGVGERTGAAMDRAAEKTVETANAATEKAAETAKKAAEATKEAAQKAVEKTGEALEKAGESMQK